MTKDPRKNKLMKLLLSENDILTIIPACMMQKQSKGFAVVASGVGLIGLAQLN